MKTGFFRHVHVARPALAAGFVSVAVLTVSLVASQAAPTTTLTFRPIADARVEAATPDTNFGVKKGLLVDAVPTAKESYLRFDVRGVKGRVDGAKLRLFVFDGSTDGPAVYATEDGWSETAITWSTRPARRGGPLDDVGAVTTGTWVELDVTAAVTGDGVHNFLLVPTSPDGADMYSREAVREGAPPPELVLTVSDATAPSVAIASPSDGSSYVSAETVTIKAEAADDSGVERVEFFDNGTLVATDDIAPYSHEWAFARADNGVHVWTALASDAAGNSAESAPVRVTVDIPDTTAPSVAIASPADGSSYTAAETVTVTAEAADDTGVERVEFFDNGTLVASDDSAPYGHEWAFARADNGIHVWTARASDAAGNVAESAPVSVTVDIPDTTAPTVAIATPAEGSSFTAVETVAVTAEAGDDTGVERVEFYDNGSLVASDASVPYSHEWALSRADNGVHVWTARASDAAGNSSESAPVSVTVEIPDTTAPTVGIASPGDGSSFTAVDTVIVAAEAGDDTGVERVEFYDNGSLVASDASAPYSHEWSLTRADNGVHVWTARASDAAGNVAESAPISVTVDIPDPLPPPPPPPPPPLAVPLTASAETDPMPNGGDAADDPAIWVNPADAAASTVIGTDKQGGLAVYDLSGRQLHYYARGKPNNVDLRTGFPLGDERVALVAATDRADNTLRLYRVDPTSRGLEPVDARAIAIGFGVYGVCLYHNAATSKYYAFVTDRMSGIVQQWELFDAGSGRADARHVRSFHVGSLSEGCVADDERALVYVAEEDVAIWRYGAEPDAGDARVKVDGVGATLTADLEGLAIYDAGGCAGYLLASSQGSDTFAVYERGGDNTYVASFAVVPGTVDGVTGTDGIDVTSAPLGGELAEGLFVAQDNTNDGGNQNFKLVPWSRIAVLLAPPALDTPCP